jgi:nucleoside-triphosphatase THEP1
MWAVARDLVVHAAARAEDLARGTPPRVAVVGPPGAGKTGALLAIVERLTRAGFAVGGYVQPARFGRSGKEGYDLRALPTGESRPFASVRRTAGGDGGYDFNEHLWEWAAALARDGGDDRVLVIDELGRRESFGRGHLPGLLAALRERPPRLLLCAVRDSALVSVQERIGSFDAVWTPEDWGPRADESWSALQRLLASRGALPPPSDWADGTAVGAAAASRFEEPK